MAAWFLQLRLVGPPRSTPARAANPFSLNALAASVRVRFALLVSSGRQLQQVRARLDRLADVADARPEQDLKRPDLLELPGPRHNAERPPGMAQTRVDRPLLSGPCATTTDSRRGVNSCGVRSGHASGGPRLRRGSQPAAIAIMPSARRYNAIACGCATPLASSFERPTIVRVSFRSLGKDARATDSIAIARDKRSGSPTSSAISS